MKMPEKMFLEMCQAKELPAKRIVSDVDDNKYVYLADDGRSFSFYWAHSTPDVPELATKEALEEVRDELDMCIEALEIQMGGRI